MATRSFSVVLCTGRWSTWSPVGGLLYPLVDWMVVQGSGRVYLAVRLVDWMVVRLEVYSAVRLVVG